MIEEQVEDEKAVASLLMEMMITVEVAIIKAAINQIKAGKIDDGISTLEEYVVSKEKLGKNIKAKHND